MYDAFMLLVDRNGGKLGGVPVQVIRKDSQFKPEVANQVVGRAARPRKCIDHRRSDLLQRDVGDLSEGHGRNVYIIGSNASPSQLAGAQCSPFYFNTNAQNDQRAEAAGKYMLDKGYKRVYTMAPNYQAGKDYMSGFKRYYKPALIE